MKTQCIFSICFLNIFCAFVHIKSGIEKNTSLCQTGIAMGITCDNVQEYSLPLVEEAALFTTSKYLSIIKRTKCTNWQACDALLSLNPSFAILIKIITDKDSWEKLKVLAETSPKCPQLFPQMLHRAPKENFLDVCLPIKKLLYCSMPKIQMIQATKMIHNSTSSKFSDIQHPKDSIKICLPPSFVLALMY